MNPKELVAELRTKLPEGEKTECTIAGKIVGDINIEGIASITNKRLIFYSIGVFKSFEFYEVVGIFSSLAGNIKLEMITGSVNISNIKTGNVKKFLDLLWNRIPADKKVPEFINAIEQESVRLDRMKEKCLIDEINYTRKKQTLTRFATQAKGVHPRKAKAAKVVTTLCIALLFIFVFNSVYSYISTLSYDTEPMSEEKYAYYAAREFISKQLKVPSSTEYARFDESEVVKTSYDGGYRVTTEVESENSFGAKLRKTFEVRVKKVDDNWILVDLEESE